MPDIVGIICEYNPFHKGHKYQIDCIKNQMPDASVVAIMSGNVVQRGEFAMLDKRARAKIALDMGVDLVLEMPYPYSGSCAEIFANAGVDIANNIGCTHLCFGIEELNAEEINKIAERINSADFEAEIKKAIEDKSVSYIVAKEIALSAINCSMPKSSNDMLAVEYMRAIKNKGYDIECLPIKRIGARYTDLNECEIMSAGAIRKAFYEEGKLNSIPNEIVELYNKEIANGIVLNQNEFFDFIHRQVVLLDAQTLEESFDCAYGMGHYVKEVAKKSKGGNDFVNKLTSKRYTTARLKRLIMYSIFGVKAVEKSIDFAVLLATNKKGKAIVSSAKKNGFVIVTKHSDAKKLDPVSKKTLDLDFFVDELFNTLLKNKQKTELAYKKKPIIE